jgi:hypothetical protein
MATADMRHHEVPYGSVPVVTWQTEAGATDINAGEPVKLKAAGSPYVIPLADGDLTIGTDTAMIGFTASASTHTASADGSVDVYRPLPGIVYAMKATTATNIDTQAELDALKGDRITIDLSGGTYTMDENAGDNANNAFYIVGGNIETGEIYFTVRTDATYLAA